MNPQENIWQFMRDNWLSNRIFTGYENLVDHCAQRPAPRDLVLLADSCLVAEPDLYIGRIEAALARDRRQRGGKVF